MPKMKASIAASLLLATAFAATPMISSQIRAQAADAREATIIVSGEGDAHLTPDMAIISLSVNKMAPTAGEALKANAEAMGTVLDALKKRGIDDRDLQTSGLSINPQYNYPDPSRDGQTAEPQLIGYQVVNTLSVRLRDVAKVGEILDQSVELGINQASGISFLNSETAKAEDEARQNAVKNAMAKAKTLADAAGIKLGRIVEMSEVSGSPTPVPMMMDASVMKSAAPTPVAIGENTLHVVVNMTIAIQ